MAETTRINHTEGYCVVCEGRIVELFVEEFDPKTGPPIFGPGSKRQFKEVSKGYYCDHCGLKYQFVPPAKTMGKA